MAARWNATVTYLAEDQPTDIFEYEEIEDLADFIEAGPCFYSVESIVIVPLGNPCGTPCECGAHKEPQP